MRLFFVSLVALGACHTSPSSPSGAQDANALCSTACATLESHGCPEAKGMGGRSCLDTCLHDTPAVVFDIHAACVATQTTDDGIRSCGVDCKK